MSNIEHLKTCDCHCHKMFEMVFDCVDCGYSQEEIEK